MKDTNFLNKIKKHKKLGLTEPSNEINKSYLEKSESNLFSAKLLMKNKRLEESVSLAYYSMYSSLLALLFRIGIKSENHLALIILLKKIFDLDNSDILLVKKERIQTQYYLNFQIKKQEVEELLKITEDFNAFLWDFISKLSNKRIDFYRNKFIKSLKL